MWGRQKRAAFSRSLTMVEDRRDPPHLAKSVPPSNNKRKKNKRRNRDRFSKPRGPPQPPQVKVTFRKVANVDKYGTAKAMSELVEEIIKRANEKLVADQKMEMDLASFRSVVENEEAALAARAEWEKKLADDIKKESEEEDKTQEEESHEPTETKEETCEPSSDAAVNGLATDVKGLSLEEGKQASSLIVARLLYVVPPKKTRRRGDKPGYAYLVMSTPLIENRTPDIPEKATLEEATEAASSEEKPVTETMPSVDYSRDVAERRLNLIRALEVLVAVAVDDAKTKQDFSGCIVEESTNGKAWKPSSRWDRLEGTIEETPDYKAFLEKTEREKEELMARPRPSPGGGASSLATTPGASDNGQPVAAIVMHLRKKQEEEKKRRQKRSKESGSKAKAKDGGGAKEGSKKNKKKRARKAAPKQGRQENGK